ncbi:Spo11/DNA topoisomerase VI subunit A [Trema orientale]|uniref:Spo11/DNA topoisomerase VI subunit A n=1 Tax=Trema orientale TaxID=63057 RepID=A0A2P5FLP5_TREOI|nr:Spo11/DNA topoisomerase VI subunit A [Trema orientale]
MNQNKASKQDETDRLLNDVATSLRCSRTSLPISTVPKGVVVGYLKFKETGSIAIDCTEVGDYRKEIPYSVSSITDIENKGAKFILLVEKDTVFLSLLDHKFYEKFLCIIITGKGMPDVSFSVIFEEVESRTLSTNSWTCGWGCIWSLNFFPLSLRIKKMSFDNENLLGIRPSDVEKYDISEESVATLSEREISILNRMLSVDGPIEKKLGMESRVDFDD